MTWYEERIESLEQRLARLRTAALRVVNPTDGSVRDLGALPALALALVCDDPDPDSEDTEEMEVANGG